VAKPVIVCKECAEPEVKLRKDGIYECGVCGHMFTKAPIEQPPKMKGNWKPEKPVKGVKK
jgi:ribosomal protein L37AE/L43A